MLGEYKQSLIAVVASTLVFGLMGCCAGFFLGKLIPDYYRAVFFNGSSPDFNPVAAGVGQGLTQGAVAGMVIGVIIVIVREFGRRAKPAKEQHD